MIKLAFRGGYQAQVYSPGNVDIGRVPKPHVFGICGPILAELNQTKHYRHNIIIQLTFTW